MEFKVKAFTKIIYLKQNSLKDCFNILSRLSEKQYSYNLIIGDVD